MRTIVWPFLEQLGFAALDLGKTELATVRLCFEDHKDEVLMLDWADLYTTVGEEVPQVATGGCSPWLIARESSAQ